MRWILLTFVFLGAACEPTAPLSRPDAGFIDAGLGCEYIEGRLFKVTACRNFPRPDNPVCIIHERPDD